MERALAPPGTREILVTRVTFLHNPSLLCQFEKYVKDDPLRFHRSQSRHELDDAVLRELACFRKNQCAAEGGVRIVKAWHGCDRAVANRSLRGLRIAGKGIITDDPKLDAGYFGRGAYFSTLPEYPMLYATGAIANPKHQLGYRPNLKGGFALVFSFVAVSHIYAITPENDFSALHGGNCKLHGEKMVEGFDTHYVRVDPKTYKLPPPNPKFRSVPNFDQPFYEEIVVIDNTKHLQ
eukprot:g2078.t1